MPTRLQRILPALAGLAALSAAAQLVINDDLTGASSHYNWLPLGGACLTAGNNQGSIPACVSLPYYSGRIQVGGVQGTLGGTGDPPGQGALRLTNGDQRIGGSNGTSQSGAVVSGFTFPSAQGVQVTFTTATYGGNGFLNLGGSQSGADGLAFFLMDADAAGAGYTRSMTHTGGLGGSLGYSCSNVNSAGPEGLPFAYLGIGIDEFGNFGNPSDNTATGKGFDAPQGSVVLRGAGNVTWAALHAARPAYYPDTLDATTRLYAVRQTCSTGTYWNFSTTSKVDAHGARIAPQQPTGEILMDYPLLARSDLPRNTTLYSQEGVTLPKRAQATPITYDLSINPEGLLNFSYSINGGAFNPVLTNQPIARNNGPIPANLFFGFSSSTGGGSNVHEILCFKAAPTSLSQSSGSLNVQQSSQVRVGTQLYLAYYHPTNWWGQLTAQDLLEDPVSHAVSLAPQARWDASCVLTGGACPATGGNPVAAQAPRLRTMLTFDGARGVALFWPALTGAQQAALDPAFSGSDSSPVLDYLRGERGSEVAQGGTLRTRTSVLGDIINASPTWVGPPSLPYAGPLRDALYDVALPEGDSYQAFASQLATRANVVYVGANDGLLHGFRAGAYTAAGDFDSTAPNDGLEVLAYMPAAIVGALRTSAANADFTSPAYAHNAMVDATPGTGDLYYAGAWHTWLVGGLGAGGNPGGIIGDDSTPGSGSIYVLDITDPTLFGQSQAPSLVLAEWNRNNLRCVQDAPATPCGSFLGNTYGTPLVRRLHDGNWAVIFGNGFNNASGRAGVYLIEVDRATGQLAARFLDTGYNPVAGFLNGIAYVSSADLDGDHVVDFLYAGDLAGNLWRFDLSASNPSLWNVRPQPLFRTGGLPVTTHVTVAVVGSAGAPRVMLDFGTGQLLPQTLTTAAHPSSTARQSLFGVWDWDLTTWNRLAPTSPVAALPAAAVSAPTGGTLTAADLQSQNLNTYATMASGPFSGVRTVTSSVVCWAGGVACNPPGANRQFGWRLALDMPSGAPPEQLVYNPQLQDGLILFNTTLPGAAGSLSCQAQPPTGYTLALLPDTGTAPTSSYFQAATQGITAPDGAPISGLGLGAVGTPSTVAVDSRKFLVTQTSSGSGVAVQVNAGAASHGRRLSWQRLR